MKKNYLGRAFNGVVIGFLLIAAGVTLAACGADPGQVTGGGGASAGGGGLLDLANKALPTILGYFGVPAGVAGAIPAVLNFLRGQKANTAKTEQGVRNLSLESLLQLVPHAADAVRNTDSGGDLTEGVSLLKGLAGDAVALLNADDNALRALIKAAIARKQGASG